MHIYYIIFLYWSLHHYTMSYVSFVRVFVLKSVWSNMVLLPLLPLTWNVFFHILSFSLCLSAWSESLVKSILKGFVFVFVQSGTLCLLTEAFNLLTFKVITDRCVLIAIYSFFSACFVVTLCSFHHLFVFPIMIWWLFCEMLTFLSFLWYLL